MVGGAGRVGQRLQGGQHRLAGLGLQQPVKGDHPLDGGRQPQAPLLVLPLGAALGGVGVGDPAQVGDDPAQPGWVQPSGGSSRTGSASAVVEAGRSWVPWAQDLGVGGRELPVGQGLAGLRQGAAVQGAGGADPAGGGGGAQPQPGAEPPGDGGGPAGPGRRRRRRGRPPQPVSFQPVQQPPQLQDPLGQAASARPSRSWAASSSTAVASAVSSSAPVECTFEFWREPIRPSPGRKHPNPNLETTSCRRSSGR
jgi:hypothetical protein